MPKIEYDKSQRVLTCTITERMNERAVMKYYRDFLRFVDEECGKQSAVITICDSRVLFSFLFAASQIFLKGVIYRLSPEYIKILDELVAVKQERIEPGCSIMVIDEKSWQLFNRMMELTFRYATSLRMPIMTTRAAALEYILAQRKKNKDEKSS